MLVLISSSKNILKIAPLAIALLLSVSAVSQYPSLDSLVSSEMKDKHIPGLSLAIIEKGKTMVCKGYGYADKDNSIKVTPQTVFEIGSLSKQFIATCIVMLAEQGKLSISDPVKKYFPDAPDTWRDITIRNLLTHTSGIERESPMFSFMKVQFDSVLIKATYKDALHFKPGTHWEYSNMGYFMLADIIRKVSLSGESQGGQSFENYMNNFFSKCGMTQTITNDKSKGPYKTRGYSYNDNSGITSKTPDVIALRPSGAFSSSILDMIKWDSIRRESPILSVQGWKRLWTDTVRTSAKITNGQVEYYGYGWFVTTLRNGHRLVYHGGNEPGFTSMYWDYVDDGVSIIMLTNLRAPDLMKFVKKIALELKKIN